MRPTERAESVIRRRNAFCVLCDDIANGTLTDLANAGWTPAGVDGGWYCREHRGLTADEHEALDGLPWWATWGPHTLQAMCAPIPAVDRSHWTLTGPDVVVVKGKLAYLVDGVWSDGWLSDDDQMRMAA